MEKWLVSSYIVVGLSLALTIGIIVGLSLPSFMFVRAEITPVHPKSVRNASAIYNITMANAIVLNYFSEHQYYENVYDCDQMASDLWDQAMAAGLEAKLVVGSVNRITSQRTSMDHAWVVVMIQNDQWLALDPVAGSLYFYSDRPKYYRGLIFDNPAQMQDFLYHYTLNGEPLFTNIKPLENSPLGH